MNARGLALGLALCCMTVLGQAGQKRTEKPPKWVQSVAESAIDALTKDPIILGQRHRATKFDQMSRPELRRYMDAILHYYQPYAPEALGAAPQLALRGIEERRCLPIIRKSVDLKSYPTVDLKGIFGIPNIDGLGNLIEWVTEHHRTPYCIRELYRATGDGGVGEGLANSQTDFFVRHPMRTWSAIHRDRTLMDSLVGALEFSDFNGTHLAVDRLRHASSQGARNDGQVLKFRLAHHLTDDRQDLGELKKHHLEWSVSRSSI